MFGISRNLGLLISENHALRIETSLAKQVMFIPESDVFACEECGWLDILIMYYSGFFYNSVNDRSCL